MLEGFSRAILEPVDFLRPVLMKDTVLGRVIKPGTGAHDAWGFRNKTVPASAQIIAIGDSQTYGISAPAKDSWPAALQEISKLSVYSLSLGSYGPVQYYHLLTNRALILKPRLVVVGFYFGNDLSNAYRMVQKNEHWRHLKRAGFPIVDEAMNPNEEEPTVGAAEPVAHSVRYWLGTHSVLYNVVVHSALGELVRVMEAKSFAGQAQDEAATLYNKNGILTGFTPERRLKALDLKDPRMKEGLLISLDLFSRMNAYCLEHNVRFLVALIPTKENVYATYLENDHTLDNADAIRSLLANERTINATVKDFFKGRKIAYVDLLPDMQQQVSRMPLYPGSYDGHPNKNGNRVIAETVARYLRERPPELIRPVPVAVRQ
jgi:lysophospholipase L1-like esterase